MNTLTEHRPSAERLRHDWAQLDHASILANAMTEQSTRRGGRARRLVAAAVIAGVAIAVPALRGGGGGASAEAADLLNRAAVFAQQDPPIAPGRYWKVTTSTHIVNCDGDWPIAVGCWSFDITRVTYRSPDGGGGSAYEERYGDNARQISGPVGLGRPSSGVTVCRVPGRGRTDSGNWQRPTPAFLAGLPRDVDALRERLYDDSTRSGRSPDGEVVVYVADVLRSGAVPADLRSSLFRVLATVPGVEVTSRAVPGLPSPTVGLGRSETVDGTRQEILLSPGGEYLGEREMELTGRFGLPAGTVTRQSQVVRAPTPGIPAELLRQSKNC